MSLSAADLAYMRGTLTESLPDTCSIDHITKVADAAGGRTKSVQTTDDVPCRFSEASDKKGGELIDSDVLTASSAWLFTFPIDENTDPDIVAAVEALDVPDQIRVGERTFDVEAFFPRSWEISRRVYCKEVR